MKPLLHPDCIRCEDHVSTGKYAHCVWECNEYVWLGGMYPKNNCPHKQEMDAWRKGKLQ